MGQLCRYRERHLLMSELWVEIMNQPVLDVSFDVQRREKWECVRYGTESLCLHLSSHRDE